MGWWLLLFSVVYFIYLFAMGLICGQVLIVVVVVATSFECGGRVVVVILLAVEREREGERGEEKREMSVFFYIYYLLRNVNEWSKGIV